MTNSDYKRSGELAGKRDALMRQDDGAARAWFDYVDSVGERDVSPAGRHLFEVSYERAFRVHAPAYKAGTNSSWWARDWQAALSM